MAVDYRFLVRWRRQCAQRRRVDVGEVLHFLDTWGQRSDETEAQYHERLERETAEYKAAAELYDRENPWPAKP